MLHSNLAYVDIRSCCKEDVVCDRVQTNNFLHTKCNVPVQESPSLHKFHYAYLQICEYSTFFTNRAKTNWLIILCYFV